MKKTLAAILTITMISAMTACQKAEEKVTIKEPGKTITIIDDTKQEESKPNISVEKIDQYEKVNITDWLDGDTVVVSKENKLLDKMSLAELSEQYPRSLYWFNLTTKEYKLLKEQKEVFLEGAVLSKDKQYLLYNEYSLGDPAFHLLNLETMKDFVIIGEPIGGAISAKWGDNETVIGAAYSGGAYLADRTGKITSIDGLEEEALYLVEKTDDNIYYNTQYDGTLMKFNIVTKEKVSLDLEQVYDIQPSPDKKQMLVVQANGNKSTMLVYDLESGEKITVAEGTELNGVSWSPDQRLIAYNLKEDVNNSTASNLYVYDVLTGESTKIAVDIENSSISWSPSGDKLAYSEYDGTQYNSSVIYLK
jgi:TolB protein